MRGISIWLFSKIAMLIFLILIFGIVLSFMNMLDERAYTDAAEVITMNVKDAIQGVLSSGTLAGQRVVPLPERIPEDVGEERAKEYTLVLTEQRDTVSVALAWGTFTRLDSEAYVTASLLYVDSNVYMKPSITPPKYLIINSKEHRFFVVNKTTVAGRPQVYVGGCKDVDLTDCTQ